MTSDVAPSVDIVMNNGPTMSEMDIHPNPTVAKSTTHEKKPAQTLPRKKPVVEVIAKILTVADGRDKTFKLIQYTSRLILRAGSTRQLKPYLDRSGLSGPLNPLISHMSMVRQIIRLGNWISTLSEVCHEWEFKVTKDRFVLLVDLYTEVFDDIYCLGKMGVLKNKRLLAIADVQAVRGWFIAIIFNLRDEFVKYQNRKSILRGLNGRVSPEKLAALKEESYTGTITTTKLLCDFVFCGIDFFELDVDPAYQIITGLLSGILGYHKLYRKLA